MSAVSNEAGAAGHLVGLSKEAAENLYTGVNMALPQPSCSPEKFGQRTTSNIRRPRDVTLVDGDIVVFRRSGILYGVAQTTDDVRDSQGIFNLVPLQEGAQSTDPVAQLVVVCQGPWLGFKSPAAGGRFLQARRRGPDHLCFYNTNWGTWEQWELVGDEPQGGWTTWTFQFRSRRLENFVFAVEVERINRGAVSTSITHGHVERLVQSVQENVDEKQGNVLRAMSSLLTSEWKHFMQREIQARRALQAELETLRRELLDVRDGAVFEIGKLNQDAEATITHLMDHIAAKEEEARRLDELYAATFSARAAHQERFAESLGHKKERSRVRNVFNGWRDTVLLKKQSRALETRISEARRNRLTSRAFGAWEQVWRRRVQLAAAEGRVRERVRSSVMARVMRAWLQWSEERRLVKKMVKEGKRRREVGLARRVMSQWRALVDLERERSEVLERLMNTWQGRTARRAFAKWRDYVEARKAKRMLAGQLRRARQLRMARMSFHAWRCRANLKAEKRRRAEQLARAFQRRRLGSVLTAWREEVRSTVEAERNVIESRKGRLAAAAFEAWQSAVTDRRLRATLADGMRERLEAQLRARAFDMWLSAVEDHRRGVREAARLEGIARERRVRRTFVAWREGTTAARERERVVDFLGRQAERSALAVVLDGWKMVVQRKRAARELKAGLRRRWAARCGVMAFEAWRDYAAEGRDRRSTIESAARYADRRMQVRTVRAWREVVAGRMDLNKAVEAARRIVGRGCLRRSFAAWREETERERERTLAETEQEERQWRRAEAWARKRALWDGFRVWHDSVAAAQEKRLEESHAEIEQMLREERATAWAKRSLLEATFLAWRTEVSEVLEERRAAEEKKREKRVREEAEEVRKVAVAERWAIKRRLERGFRVWREEAEGARIDRLAARIAKNEEQIEMEKAEARRVEFADRWGKRRLEERGFRAWTLAMEAARDEAENERAEEELERAREKWAGGWAVRRRLERVWGVWRGEVQRTVNEKEEERAREEESEVQAEAFAGKWAKRRLLERAFGSWILAVDETKEEEKIVQEKECRAEQREEEKEKRADRWAQRRLVEATFKGWVGLVEQSAEEREVAETNLRIAEEEATRKEEQDASRAATWATRRLLEAGFYAWAEAVHVAKEERAIEEKEEWRSEVRAVIWAKRRMLERAFFAWEGVVKENFAERAEEERRQAAQLEAEQRVRRRVLLAWREVTSAAQEERAQEEEARRAVMRGAFDTWMHETSRSLGIGREIAKRRQLSQQRRAFAAWKEALWRAAAIGDAAEHLKQQSERQLLTSALAQWRDRVSRQVLLRRRLSLYREARRSRELAAALRRWCHVAARRRTLRLAGQRVAARVNRRRLGEAFSAWEEYVGEKVAARGELGACITRKKMAKRWFMQWYWDAFDNEIHRSLVDIVSSTQLSINEAERAPLPASGTNGHSAGRNFGAPGRNSADDWKALLNRGLEARTIGADLVMGLDASSNGHSAGRNLGAPGRNSADDWKALLNRGLEARSLGAAPPRGLDSANGVRLGRSERYENGTESLNGTSNGKRSLPPTMPTAGLTVGLQARTAGKDSASGDLTFGVRKNGPRQLPPLGNDVSRLGSNGVKEQVSRSVTGSLGRWNYLKKDGFLEGLRTSRNGVSSERNILGSEQEAGEERIEGRSTEFANKSLLGNRNESRGYAWRSLDLGQGPAKGLLEEKRPRTSSGSGERDKKSSY
ncbi:hypothetical protein KFL_000120230 [Klebsormidium nitens]|uniref:Sfi1 spindle body domain-containing protein n=1 Tax=Klebsormidium nitens TaxID=105231 RepID=A0A1Y1HP40_KLENI|nr:hypothetical protein KFL_000120230 [Klebsormidium nitens]|eukprot:GAQ78376.1 hypothetical protein KFL_000120230 [Klebsormidium nitens]